MNIDRSVRWLHISDLRCPGSGDDRWEDATSAAVDRLADVRQAWGSIDLVLVSGDVARTGGVHEYSRASKLLSDIRRALTSEGASPIVLAVPGNHDANLGDGGSGMVDLSETFANWRGWFGEQTRLLSPKVTLRLGKTPGDFAATIDLRERELRVGVVGINTETEPRPFERPRAGTLDDRLKELCGVDPRLWMQHHHVAVALTHRPPPAPIDTRVPETPGTLERFAGIGFRVVHASDSQGRESDVVVRDPGNLAVVRAMSFTGSDEPLNGEVNLWRPQGGVVVELAVDHPTRALLRGWIYPVHRDGKALRPDEPIEQEPAWRQHFDVSGVTEALSADLPPPVVFEPSVARPAALVASEKDLTPEAIKALLDGVLPDEADFDGFVLERLPETYANFGRGLDRRRRTEAMLEMNGPRAVFEALRRYLPDTTAERWSELRSRSRNPSA